MIKTSIQLNSSPRNILEVMSSTIDFPLPPSESFDDMSNIGNTTVQNTHANPIDDLIWNAGMFRDSKTTSRTIHDCNLINFLQDMNIDDVKVRKLNRINASAAALVARRAYQFSAIDGTGLGWSSASLAILLNRLTELYDEHKCKLQTKSFYPFRLVLSGDEFSKKIDLYSGAILLNPAATPLQWLNTLQAITDESVQRLKYNRKVLEKNLSAVQSYLNVKVKKGYSCEPEDYHNFIQKIALLSAEPATKEVHNASFIPQQLNSACLVIESDQACRRCKLRKDGNIEAAVNMSLEDIRSALNKFAAESNQYRQSELKHQQEYKQVQQRAIYELGLQSISKVGNLVTYGQMSHSLLQLLKRDDDEKEKLRKFITGQALGITGRGQPCHLGDDGSIIIPWNVS